MEVKSNFSVFKTILVLLCSVYQICAQDNIVFSKILEKLNTYTTLNTPEKVYLQTDKDYYTNGDTLWFKTYILDGISHTASDKSRVVYVELLDAEQKVIEQRRIYTGFEGGSGDIAIAENINEGSYYLRAYTKYMLNEKDPVIYQKEIPIWAYSINSKKKPEKASLKKRKEAAFSNEIGEIMLTKPVVQFFPEGGNLVTGLNNVLGLKITDGAGKGLALKGKIIDQNGSLITMFGTYDFGLGQVQFQVAQDTQYYVEIKIDGNLEKYMVPKSISKGYVLQISNKGEFIQIQVTTNIANGLNGAFLIGHLRGETILKYRADGKTENTYELKLSTAELNDGVASFTLFTPEGERVCERLVFVENPNNATGLSLKTDATKYGLRKKVNVDLTVFDELGLPLSGNFSMSVSSQKGITNRTTTIKSWLLLNSDLGGTVENPNYFFEEDSKSRKILLDILMLTHGWRRFVWKDLETKETDSKLRFPPEKGLVIKGSTVNSKNRNEALKSSVQLTIAEPSVYKEVTSTDVEGDFSFGPLIFRDSIKAVINEVDDKKEIAIYLEPSFPNVETEDSIGQPIQFNTKELERAYREEAFRKKVNDFEYDPKVIKLDEATGRGRLKTKKQLINEALNERTMYGQALNRVIPDSILGSDFNSAIDLIERNVAGVTVKGQYPNQSIELRSASSFGSLKTPLYLLDGIAVDPSLVNEMFGAEILFIDVLTSPGETAQYGMRGRFGVIAIYTPRGQNYEFVQEKELDVTNFMIPGFYRAREFYSPSYSLVKPELDKPDFRTTLYWEPDINISDIEPTNLAFYTGDNAGVYTIRVEGMTHDGRPVSGVYTFTIGEY